MAKIIKTTKSPMGRVFEAVKEHYSDSPDDSPDAAESLPIGKQQVDAAREALRRYKAGKQNLEARIIEDEQWYKRRHWDVMRNRNKSAPHPEPTSAWLFNTLMNKHADANDYYPKPNVLPREESDREAAEVLTQILPVIMERCDFEQTYSDNWWEKLKHGTAAYGVFWNPSLENGLGDIDIKMIDLLNIFWEPGITDIQQSEKLFIVNLWSTEAVENAYPETKGKVGGDQSLVKQYIYDDAVDVSDKTAVVDCYYKVRDPDGRTLVHLMKFCGENLLYASENDELYRNRGFYDHGMYPVVFDNIFTEKGTPVGFGYVAITKDPQMYIDKLSANILETSMMATKVRYFALGNTGINEEEFLDWNRPIVHVEGNSLEDARLKQIKVAPIEGIYFNVLQQKINEMKETAANRDVNAGASTSGVTAAAAITALQEAGSKASRDMVSAAYRAYVKINYLCIELIRQFYDESRSFRIMGKDDYEFKSYSNAALKETALDEAYLGQAQGEEYTVQYRRPVFDITIEAEKRSPFSQMTLNETAKELYKMGAFDPKKADEAILMLSMMEFEGKERIIQQIKQGKQRAAQAAQTAQAAQSTKPAGGALKLPQPAQRAGQAASAQPAVPAAPTAAGGENMIKNLQRQLMGANAYPAQKLDRI